MSDKKKAEAPAEGETKPARSVLPADIQTLARIQRILGKLPLPVQGRIVSFLSHSIADSLEASEKGGAV